MREMTDERVRTAIEDAVTSAMEFGWPASAVREEVDYAIGCFQDEEAAGSEKGETT